MAESTPELKTYYGNCHCGAFKFSVKLPELKSAMACNCSYCLKKGIWWVMVGPGNLTVEQGEEHLKSYEFGNRVMAHKFCPTCGTGVYGKVKKSPEGVNIGINARTLRDVDLWSLEITKMDGAALEPQYIPHPYTGPEPTAKFENAKVYTGTCHCGAVGMAMKTAGPLPSSGQPIEECDCSICSRIGLVFTYPKADQVEITNASFLTYYSFGRKFRTYAFCPVCGVCVWVKKSDLTLQEYNAYGDADEDYDVWKSFMNVNLRVLEGVEWDDIKIERVGNDSEPKYVV
ncbi:Mss4-like protein [Cadophora sp. MPI-SDFR-AT-0126]|nr:Mss4-like protein [Leotiomycetes sp. MPI-SDFR-AT-0126]